MHILTFFLFLGCIFYTKALHASDLQKIPDEVLLQIMEAMPHEDLLQFGLTCKHYHALTQEVLLKRASQRNLLEGISSEDQFIQRLEQIKAQRYPELIIAEGPPFGKNCDRVDVRFVEGYRHLSKKREEYPFTRHKDIETLIKNLKTLYPGSFYEKIKRPQYVQLTESMLQILEQELPQMKHIKSLKLGHFKLLGANKRLLDAVKKMPGLKNLRQDLCWTPGPQELFKKDIYLSLTQLEGLSLMLWYGTIEPDTESETQWQPWGIEEVQALRQSLPGLKRLKFKGPYKKFGETRFIPRKEVSPFCTQEAADFLMSQPFEKLELHAVAAREKLPEASPLKSIKGTQLESKTEFINVEGSSYHFKTGLAWEERYICPKSELFENCPDLETLYIHNESFATLSEMKLKNLKKLSVRDLYATRDGYENQELLEFLGQHPNLEFLDLRSMQPFSKLGLHALLNPLPHLPFRIKKGTQLPTHPLRELKLSVSRAMLTHSLDTQKVLDSVARISRLFPQLQKLTLHVLDTQIPTYHRSSIMNIFWERPASDPTATLVPTYCQELDF